MLTQGGRARTPAPLLGERTWGATMQSLHGVRLAMQSIQDVSVEVRQKLEKQWDSGIKLTDVELEQCIDILTHIWEVTSDYEEQATRTRIQPSTLGKATDAMAPGSFHEPPVGRSEPSGLGSKPPRDEDRPRWDGNSG